MLRPRLRGANPVALQVRDQVNQASVSPGFEETRRATPAPIPVTGGLTIANSTTTSYAPTTIQNRCDDAAIGVGDLAWNFAVDPGSAPGTSGTTVTAVDGFIRAVPFGLSNPGRTQSPSVLTSNPTHPLPAT